MEKKFYSKVFMWLFIGLLLTFGSGVLVLYSPALMNFVYNSSGYIVIIVLQLVLALIFSFRIHKMEPTTAKLCYLGYAFLTGLTLSSIFIIFELGSIIYVFLVTAFLFGIFAFLGTTTNLDLSKLGTYLLIALLGIILLEFINIFLMNNTLDMVTSVLVIVVFLGFVSYDMQHIKNLSVVGADDDKLALYGAFQLYLDIINLFIELLKLFGKEKD